MLAYFYAFVDDNKQPTGYTGIAIGRDVVDVMCAIDSAGDPFSVVIKKITARSRGVSICLKRELDNSEFREAIFTEFETESDELYEEDYSKWRKFTQKEQDEFITFMMGR